MSAERLMSKIIIKMYNTVKVFNVIFLDKMGCREDRLVQPILLFLLQELFLGVVHK